MMKVIIDPKALKFIQSKNEDSIRLWLDGCGSWGPSEPKPSVEMGKPEELEDFDLYTIDGINAYVDVAVQTKNEELVVKHAKILWNEKLIVEGMAF